MPPLLPGNPDAEPTANDAWLRSWEDRTPDGIAPAGGAVADQAAPAARPGEAGALCPVDRLPRRRRNQMCIGIIALGLLNYLVYTLTFAALGGDAHNGHRAVLVQANGKRVSQYYIRGHFLHSLDGYERVVSRATWLYSYIHSISVPLTSGAMLISMLVLARPHILATMRGGFFSGQTFVTAFGTIIVLATAGATFMIAGNFVVALTSG